MDDQPATKKDLASTKEDLFGRMQELEQRTQEMIRDSQTEILRGFEAYAKTSEARLGVWKAVFSCCTRTTRP
ncbi:MAG: hypothetical protein ABSH32_06350 [Bryobacteraceae bacterium]|jgi:hypothetical protein